MNDSSPLLIGGAGLVKGSVKGFGPALAELSYELSESISSLGWIDKAPFSAISLIVRYDTMPNLDAEVGKINSHMELEVAIQAGIDELRDAKGDISEIKKKLRPYVHNALEAVAAKYALGTL